MVDPVIKGIDRESGRVIDKALAILKLQGLCVALLAVGETVSDFSVPGLVFRGFFWTSFFVLFARVARRLLYSYWAFLVILTLYALGFLADPARLSLGEALVVSALLGLNVWQALPLMSPVYYPMPNWWEYDFRCRSDVKAMMVAGDGSRHHIRINEARMGAVSVSCFHELASGEKVFIDGVEGMDRDFGVSFDVVSVRSGIVGRPDIVGLVLSDDKDGQRYDELRGAVGSKRLSVRRFVRHDG